MKFACSDRRGTRVAEPADEKKVVKGSAELNITTNIKIASNRPVRLLVTDAFWGDRGHCRSIGYSSGLARCVEPPSDPPGC
jgi:hypothetical protein